ncbi:MAG: DUF99 family protein [Thermoplasmatota archaeon]
MKKQIRLLGIDDSPFAFTDKSTTVIGAIMRGGQYLECVLKSEVLIDGKDATHVCIDMVTKTRFTQQLKAVLLDGASLGGFNVIDIERLYKETNIPIITVTRYKPDFNKIRKALEKKFYDWKERLSILERGELSLIETVEKTSIYIKYTGISLNQAKEIINVSTIRGSIPEPIRVAHVIASGICRGESYGKA